MKRPYSVVFITAARANKPTFSPVCLKPPPLPKCTKFPNLFPSEFLQLLSEHCYAGGKVCSVGPTAPTTGVNRSPTAALLRVPRCARGRPLLGAHVRARRGLRREAAAPFPSLQSDSVWNLVSKCFIQFLNMDSWLLPSGQSCRNVVRRNVSFVVSCSEGN